MVGGERPRPGAPGERLQRRRFDLDEVALVQPLADRGDDLARVDEQLARLLVGDQVELAVAVARAGVAEPVVLVRRRAQRLGQQRALAAPPAPAARAGSRRRSPRRRRCRRCRGPGCGRRPPGRARRRARTTWIEPGQVAQVEERRLAVAAPRDQRGRRRGSAAPGARPGSSAAGSCAASTSAISVRVSHRRDVRVGVDPFRAQPLHLRAALVDFDDAVGVRASVLVDRCLRPPALLVVLIRAYRRRSSQVGCACQAIAPESSRTCSRACWRSRTSVRPAAAI